ncbi:DUF421 domain-containing protein [Bacillus massiliglaciei]|uniref:DUF421 domain-containing protein n=1 Tax=Bacillus massiliglaciei TaxID=1816693 RepID=UPI000DA5EEB8|nr:DUF421 domain-containing protein [Bacillus massiliglaciei]
MEGYLVVVLKTLLIYIFILVIFRLMGKREIGELSILDLVVFVMIGDIAVMAIEDPDKPIMKAFAPMIVLLIIQFLSSLFSLKSAKFREVVDGEPSIIINQGKIDEKVMRKQRYNFDDLLTQIRSHGILDLNEIEYAILESSGDLSVIRKHGSQKSQKVNSPYPLVLDGKIQERNLREIKKDAAWLREQLKKKGYKNPEHISYCSYMNGEIYIDIKDEKENE